MGHRIFFVLLFFGCALPVRAEEPPATKGDSPPPPPPSPFILKIAEEGTLNFEESSDLPWLDDNGVEDFSFKSRELIEQRFAKDDPMVQKFALLTFGDRFLSVSERNTLAKDLLQYIANEPNNNLAKALAPYIYDTIQSSKKITIPEKKNMIALLLKDEKPSCAAIDIFNEHLTDKTYIRNNKTASLKFLEQLSKVNDVTNIVPTLRVFTNLVSPADRKSYQAALLPFVQRSSTIANLSSWTEQLAEGSANPGKGGSFLKIVKAITKRRNCAGAKQTVFRGIKDKPKSASSMSLSTAMASIDEVDRCYRNKGGHDRVAFWNFFIPAMEKRYGDDAWGQMQLQIARIQWNNDDNVESVKRVNAILEKKDPPISDDVYANATFLLGRIEDNDGQYNEAAKHYEAVLERFPNFAQTDEIRKFLILIRIGQSRWGDAYEAAHNIIIEQDAKSIDERDPASLGFALFWAGRAATELGRGEEGLGHWRRCALELYSTYYGAIGHYMLESVLGKRLVLKSTGYNDLDPEYVRHAFKGQDAIRSVRIENLLHLGLKHFARCEAHELPEGRPRQILAKALFLHRAGDWLESIRLYNDIPRSYRQTLPLKTERILFPKRFSEDIRKYSEKMRIDPHFVLSLIRQESVFNPNAHSPAGAAGLMQLMQKTAKDEAKKLEASYVSAHQKQTLMRKARNHRALFEVETNLILGVHHFKSLLEKYENPLISLSAYNAGPTVTSKWLKKYDARDALYFVERIPYNETRNYIKLIVRNYFYYKKWYGRHNEAMVHLEPLFQNLALNQSIAANKPI